MRRAFFPLLAVALAVAVVFPSLAADDQDAWTLGLEKIASMSGLVRDHYFKSVETDPMVEEIIKGMLQTLDPHSYLLEPDSFSRLSEEQRGRYFGVGLQIQKQEDRLVVVSPIEGGPSWRLGVLAGDIITHINGESTKPITDRDAVSKLRGPKGTKVEITLAREGQAAPIVLTVTREEIPLYSVPYAFLLDGGVGYVFIRYFAENTVDELEDRLGKLVAQGAKSLILDLRGNAGGPLFQAVDMSDEFLARGEPIVSIRGRNPLFDRDFRAQSDDQYERLPLVVLINQGSASASEIVAGAVMDRDRGLVVGEDSWGKGLVQQMFPLAPDMAVALTVGQYFTPSGRSIQRDYSHYDDYILDKQPVPEKSRSVFTTARGRKVLGQGGITPDYEVPFRLTDVAAELRYRGAFFTYARRFVGHQTALSKSYLFPSEAKPGVETAGKVRVERAFFATPDVLADFGAYLRSVNIPFDAKRFKEAEADVKRELEREITSALWTLEEGWRAFERTDPVVLKAVQVLPEAAKLLN